MKSHVTPGAGKDVEESRIAGTTDGFGVCLFESFTTRDDESRAQDPVCGFWLLVGGQRSPEQAVLNEWAVSSGYKGAGVSPARQRKNLSQEGWDRGSAEFKGRSRGSQGSSISDEGGQFEVCFVYISGKWRLRLSG